MNLCVIPARGGSKRIPGKNIKDFCGKPIIAYSIEAAMASGCFAKVVVSTDDDAIAEVALSLGAEVPFRRPPEISNDHASSGVVMSHAVGWFAERGETFEYVCMLYATAPFVGPDRLAEALGMLRERPDCSYCFTAVEFPAPIQRALRRDERGLAAMFQPENYEKRSQDLEPAFHDAGQFYWGRPEAWAENRPVFLEPALMYVMPRSHVEDIDTPDDWVRAERLFRDLAA